MLRKKILTIASLTIVGFIPLAQAADRFDDDRQSHDDRRFDDDRWYIAPFASFVRTGGDRDASDGWGGGMGIGKMLDKHFN
ncbi:MAG: OmpA family protein, partial [Methylobacter sp.]|nr:OmpA family protein [Methylobacter sp.]MDP1969816.1 OmpA family protein [Methylobacter sp.]